MATPASGTNKARGASPSEKGLSEVGSVGCLSQSIHKTAFGGGAKDEDRKLPDVRAVCESGAGRFAARSREYQRMNYSPLDAGRHLASVGGFRFGYSALYGPARGHVRNEVKPGPWHSLSPFAFCFCLFVLSFELFNILGSLRS
jgi:hypothetical protein